MDNLRNEFLTRLTESFSNEDVAKIISIYDSLAINYDVNSKSTEIITQEEYIQAMYYLKMYISDLKISGCSDGTIKNFTTILRNFFSRTNILPSNVTKDDIRAYLFNYQKERNVSGRTLNTILSSLKSFFGWLEREDYIIKNPCKGLKPIKHEAKMRDYLTYDELEKVRRACNNIKEKAFIEFLYSTGCRISELANIKLGDVDFNNMTVKLYNCKCQKNRIVYLSTRCKYLLKDYLQNRKYDGEYLFLARGGVPYQGKDGFERMFRKIVDKTDIQKHVTCHTMRHTMATHMIQNGAKVQDVQKILGHENIETTMIYVELDKDSIKTAHKHYLAS